MAQDAEPHRFLKIVAVFIGACIAALAAATLALKMLLPPEKIKSLIAQEAGKFLGREVRIKNASAGLLQGLRVEGVEVSEKPDFKAGAFVSVDSFDFRIQLMPLLSKRVIIDRVVVAGPSARIVKAKDGSFNFSDLFSRASPTGRRASRGPEPSAPEPSKTAQPPPASPLDLPFVLDVKRARISDGKLLYADPGAGIEMTVSGLQVSADGVSLERPFGARLSFQLNGRAGAKRLAVDASAGARFDLSRMKRAAAGAIPVGVSGLKTELSMSVTDPSAGLDAKVSGLRATIDEAKLDEPFEAAGSMEFDGKSGSRRARGLAKLLTRLDVSRIAEGIASADLHSLSLEAAGLKADLSMKVSLNPKQASLTRIEGALLGGKLTGLLKVKDYAASPDIRLEADLTSVDLEKLLAANEATTVAPPPGKPSAAKAPAQTPAAAHPEAGPKAPGGPPTPAMSTSGRITVGEVRHQFAKAKDIKLDWDLKGITPELDRLAGYATMKVADGHFSALDSLAARSKVLKVLALPFIVLQKIGKIPMLNKIMPEFNTVTFSEIIGDYVFERGVMTLRSCGMKSSVANVTATGSANLPRSTLAITVMSQVGRLAPIGIDVTGTFDQPKTRIKASTIVSQPIGKAVEPAKKLIEGLFKRRR
ncbi:MAG: AsmA family protein [Elusimicrobia bacterium]|nr:AsmA family protein [Elusimicrobiota bacterium]